MGAATNKALAQYLAERRRTSGPQARSQDLRSALDMKLNFDELQATLEEREARRKKAEAELKRQEKADKLAEEVRAAEAAYLEKMTAQGQPEVVQASRTVPAYDIQMPQAPGDKLKLSFAFNPENEDVKRGVITPAVPAGPFADTPEAEMIKAYSKSDTDAGVKFVGSLLEAQRKARADADKWDAEQKRWEARFDAQNTEYDRREANKPPTGGKWVQDEAGEYVWLENPTYTGNTGTGGTGGRTRADRNNNPLNIKASEFTKKLPGVTGIEDKPAQDGGNFLIFDSPESGYKAGMALWRKGRAYQGVTVAQGLKAWSGGGYGADVAQAAGINPAAAAQSLNDADLKRLFQAMAKREGFTGGGPVRSGVKGGKDKTIDPNAETWENLTPAQKKAYREDLAKLEAKIDAASETLAYAANDPSYKGNKFGGKDVALTPKQARIELDKAHEQRARLLKKFPELREDSAIRDNGGPRPSEGARFRNGVSGKKKTGSISGQFGVN